MVKEVNVKGNTFYRKIKSKKNILIVILISAIILTSLLVGFKMEQNTKVIINTNVGDITLELYNKESPITVNNFLDYVDSGYYDGLIFHRVMDKFMIQGGGFFSNGSEKNTNPPIKLESNNGLKNNKGTIAMARTYIPDSATSQFFINLEDNDFLNYGVRDEGYAVFGKVINGMNIVEKIGIVKTGNRYGMEDWPTEDIIIKSIKRK